jgi:hypothetical protein
MIDLPVVEHVSQLVKDLASRTTAKHDADETSREEAEEVTQKCPAMECSY